MSVLVFSLCEITNPHDNFKIYVKKAADLVAKYGGEYVVRGKPVDDADAPFAGQSLVGLRFPTQEAYDAYREEYKSLLPLREGSGVYLSATYAG